MQFSAVLLFAYSALGAHIAYPGLTPTPTLDIENVHGHPFLSNVPRPRSSPSLTVENLHGHPDPQHKLVTRWFNGGSSGSSDSFTDPKDYIPADHLPEKIPDFKVPDNANHVLMSEPITGDDSSYISVPRFFHGHVFDLVTRAKEPDLYGIHSNANISGLVLSYPDGGFPVDNIPTEVVLSSTMKPFTAEIDGSGCMTFPDKATGLLSFMAIPGLTQGNESEYHADGFYNITMQPVMATDDYFNDRLNCNWHFERDADHVFLTPQYISDSRFLGDFIVCDDGTQSHLLFGIYGREMNVPDPASCATVDLTVVNNIPVKVGTASSFKTSAALVASLSISVAMLLL